MKKILFYILIIIIVVGFSTPVQIYASTHQADTGYELLTPLPCGEDLSNCDDEGNFATFDPTDDNSLGRYLNMMLRIFIGISAVLAMAMIVLGGLEYMTSELISSKEAGKKKIRGALLGLLLALSSYALLNTINPDLLNSDVQIRSSQEISP